MKHKKFLFILIAILALLLASCGGQPAAPAQEEAPAAEEPAAAEPAAEEPAAEDPSFQSTGEPLCDHPFRPLSLSQLLPHAAPL